LPILGECPRKLYAIRKAPYAPQTEVMIARWLACRIQTQTRRLRRSLRDYDRLQWGRIHAAERRARGLRLYAAWSLKEKAAMNYGTIVRLQSPYCQEEQANRKAV
jgi:hypothetical protein